MALGRRRPCATWPWLPRRWPLAAGLVLLSFQPLASTMRNHKQLRYLINPLNTLYALGHAAGKPLRRPRRRCGAGHRRSRVPDRRGRPPLLVLVLGETARSGNFGINGYARRHHT